MSIVVLGPGLAFADVLYEGPAQMVRPFSPDETPVEDVPRNVAVRLRAHPSIVRAWVVDDEGAQVALVPAEPDVRTVVDQDHWRPERDLDPLTHYAVWAEQVAPFEGPWALGDFVTGEEVDTMPPVWNGAVDVEWTTEGLVQGAAQAWMWPVGLTDDHAPMDDPLRSTVLLYDPHEQALETWVWGRPELHVIRSRETPNRVQGELWVYDQAANRAGPFVLDLRRGCSTGLGALPAGGLWVLLCLFRRSTP